MPDPERGNPGGERDCERGSLASAHVGRTAAVLRRTVRARHELAGRGDVHRVAVAAPDPWPVFDVVAGNGNDFVVTRRPDDDADAIARRGRDDDAVVNGAPDRGMQGAAEGAAQAHRDHAGAFAARILDRRGDPPVIEHDDAGDRAQRNQRRQWRSAGDLAAFTARHHARGAGAMTRIAAVVHRVGSAFFVVDEVVGEVEIDHARFELDVIGDPGIRLKHQDALALPHLHDPIAELEPEILGAHFMVSDVYGGGFGVEDRRLIRRLTP